MSGAILSSSLSTSLARYRRSKSLWLMLLTAPIAARFMISEKANEGVAITIDNQLPVLISPVLGIWLGIVVSTLVMPIAFIYLRANTTRRQPWQIEEVIAASRVKIALGRFLADSAILLAMLIALSLAGLILGLLMTTGPWNPLQIVGLLWLVAAPTFLATAAIRILFDAIPILRGALGDVAFLVIWMTTIITSAINSELPSSLSVNIADLGGAIRPLVEGAPAGSEGFAIGATEIRPGRMNLDVFKGIAAEGYMLSRAVWVLLAFAIAALAGLLYRPHIAKARKQRFRWLSQLSLAKLLPTAEPRDIGAGRAAAPVLRLVLMEMRLIAAGNLFPLLAIAAALVGLAPDYRHIGSPAALLLLVFALSAHAGRSEAKGLVALTETMQMSPGARRIAFVIGGILLSLGMAIPAAIISASFDPLQLALMTGAGAAVVAIMLAWATKSPITARILLIVGWYIYFSS